MEMAEMRQKVLQQRLLAIIGKVIFAFKILPQDGDSLKVVEFVFCLSQGGTLPWPNKGC